MRQHRWLSSVDIVPMQHDILGLVSLALSMAFVCFFFLSGAHVVSIIPQLVYMPATLNYSAPVPVHAL